MKEPPIGVGSAMANMQGSYQVVVKDLSVIEKIATAYETINAKPLQDGTLYLLSLKECYDFDLKCDEEKQIEIYKDILVAPVWRPATRSWSLNPPRPSSR